MKHTADESFCKLFFVNPKSDARHSHNKSKKYNQQQVTRVTLMKLNSFNLDTVKFQPVIDHPSNDAALELKTKYIDEMYNLYENGLRTFRLLQRREKSGNRKFIF